MTTQGTYTVTIDAPPEQVWPFIADVSKHSEWSPKAFSAELVSGETGKVGSRYRSRGWVPGEKEHANEVEIVESVPFERLALRSEDKMGAFNNSYTLRASGTGTEVSHTLVFPPLKGVSALMIPLVFPLVGKPDGRKRMKLLKQAVESST
ncbi:MAG TPA: SRPBCC family protein [Mycobacteriales bacterium]|nr:SRPBCC family protein [Mycobacteriales bacterium]